MKLYLAKRFYIDLYGGVICFKGGKSGEVVCEPIDVSKLDKAIEFVKEFFEEAEEEEGEGFSEEEGIEEVEEELMEISEEIE